MEKKYQIFISSTYDDLKNAREKVRDAILSMLHFPVGMEMFSAGDEEQWEIIQETIDSSDYYVLIVGQRYGSVIETGEDAGISYTEKEFRYAKAQKVPILAFILSDDADIKKSAVESDPKKIEKLRTCIHSRRCRGDEGFFRQTRRVFAGILCVLQENATQYGGKRPVHTAFEVVNTGSKCV